MRHHNRILISMAVMVMLSFFGFNSYGQSHYGSSYSGGALEYSLPLLTSIPPVDTTMPSDISMSYLWLDELMRTTPRVQVNAYLRNLSYGDTLKFLAEMLYKVIDYNALSFNNWDASSIWQLGRPLLPWNYQSYVDQERIQFQNQAYTKFHDTARTGFLLACDIISDINVTDTFIYSNPSDNITPDMVMVSTTILDPIKGQKVPLCLGEDMGTHKGVKITTQSISPWATTAVPADTGTCLQFEYSPEWSRTVAGDIVPYPQALSDSTGWWVKPGGEYIVFLYLHGVNIDSANNYFTIDPYWGVFGTQGAMYKVIGGIVQDPNDDFGLGASAGLPVSVWKSRLRARIYNILHP